MWSSFQRDRFAPDSEVGDEEESGRCAAAVTSFAQACIGLTRAAEIP